MTKDKGRQSLHIEGSQIVGSAIATGDHARASARSGGSNSVEATAQVLQAIEGLRAELSRLTDLDDDQAARVDAASGSIAGLEREVTSASPRKGRMESLMTSLKSALADVAAVATPVSALVAAIQTFSG